MEELIKEFPCRENQIKLLDTILGGNEEPGPEAVFLYGPPAVGKTSILLKYLEISKAEFVLINCIECYTHRLLYDLLVNRLLGPQSQGKCENYMDLVQRLKHAYSLGHIAKKYFIVLDGFEYLYSMSDHHLEAFCSLQELTSIYSLTVIFVSHILPQKFNLSISVIKIHFPQYSKDELLQILLKDKPQTLSEQFYKNYINAALSVFLRATRDLNEMRSLVLSNLEKYCEPLKNQVTDVNALWRHIVPHLKTSLNNVYLETGTRLEEPAKEDKMNNLVKSNALLVFDLPYYAKYFLVAAYLASYNSPKHDKQLFVKQSSKRKRRLPKKDTKDKVAAELLGPKPFSLDRLLAIFYSILEEKTSLTSNLLAQISTLVELKLLTKLGEGAIEKPKYKCFVGFQCVDAVARTLGLNLRKYLLD